MTDTVPWNGGRPLAPSSAAAVTVVVSDETRTRAKSASRRRVRSIPVAVELRDPPLEEPPLGVVVDQRQRPTVGVARLIGSAEAAQQLAARGVQVPVVLQGEAVDDVEPRLGPLRLGDRDGPAQLDDR